MAQVPRKEIQSPVMVWMSLWSTVKGWRKVNHVWRKKKSNYFQIHTEFSKLKECIFSSWNGEGPLLHGTFISCFQKRGVRLECLLSRCLPVPLAQGDSAIKGMHLECLFSYLPFITTVLPAQTLLCSVLSSPSSPPAPDHHLPCPGNLQLVPCLAFLVGIFSLVMCI